VESTLDKKEGRIMKKKKLYLSETDKKIFGVCGGIAEYFEIDSTPIRIGFLILLFGAGTGLLIYLICAVVIPKKGH